MKVLLATPYLSQHYDAGLYWAAALSRLGHSIQLWDYRREPYIALYKQAEVSIVLKGGFDPDILPGIKVNYWPDMLGRDTFGEACLKNYNFRFTCLRPTPEGMTWLPCGYDPVVHRRHDISYVFDGLFIGTSTPRKEEFLRAMHPLLNTVGNGWDKWYKYENGVYLHEMVQWLNSAKVAVNIHRDKVGVNRRLFEMIACQFTITDLVPGVEEILGKGLASKVGFSTPEQGREKLEYYLAHEADRLVLHEAEIEAIAPYSYEKIVERILKTI